MKILITGGAGYIGTELVRELEKDSKVGEIIIYDNLSRKNYNLFIGPGLTNQKIRFIQGELLDSRKLKKVLDGVDVVYHLAAKVSTPFADQDPHLFEQVNHWGTAELVYALEESDVVRCIYMSSTSVYGASNKEVDINTVPNPRTFYGISKLRGEEHFDRLAAKMPIYVLRCGNVYGFSSAMRFDAVINRFVFEANFTGSITIHGDGNQGRAFIHVDKVKQVLVGLADSNLETGKYNLVEKNVNILELSKIIKELFPHVEMLFVNQHLSLRQLKVLPDERINQYYGFEETALLDELNDLKEKLAFTSFPVLEPQ